MLYKQIYREQSKYFVKVDDDVIVNVDALSRRLSYMGSALLRNIGIFGNIWTGSEVSRDGKSRL